MSTLNVVTISTYDETGFENGSLLLVVDEEEHIVDVPKIKKAKGLGVFYNTNQFLGPNCMLYHANWQRDKFTSDQIAEVRRIVATAKVTSPKSAPFKLIASGKLGGPFRYDELSLLTSEFATLEAVVKKLKPATPSTDEEEEDESKDTDQMPMELQSIGNALLKKFDALGYSKNVGKITGMFLEMGIAYCENLLADTEAFKLKVFYAEQVLADYNASMLLAELE